MPTRRSLALQVIVSVLLAAGSAQGQCFDLSSPNTYTLTAPQTWPTVANAADADADGDIDILVTVDRIVLLRNNSDGSFTPEVVHSGLVVADSVLGDVTGDGLIDIVAITGEGGVGVKPNIGGGSYGDMVVFGTSPFRRIELADVDLDGDLDVCSVLLSEAAVWINEGAGVFGPQVIYSVDQPANSFTLADLNGDGAADLACAAGMGASVLLNNGDGTFGLAVGYGTDGDSVTRGILAIDVDGDGDLDIAVSHLNELSVVFNDGGGKFAKGPTTPSITLGLSMAGGDFDGDGVMDIALCQAGFQNGGVSIRKGHGDGAFTSSGVFVATGTATDVVAADFNGDGGTDIGVSFFYIIIPHRASEIVYLNEGGGVRQIVDQPKSSAGCEGGEVSFSVTATSGEPETYQWYRDGVALSDGATKPGSVISGATTTQLTISNLSGKDVGEYMLVLSTECGSFESEPATLTLGGGACCRTDVNHDGVVNSTDVSDFINVWFEDQAGGTLLADFNGDLVSNSTDVSDFINAWFEESSVGCE